MKRLFVILLVNTLLSLSCFSQLSKYEGIWVRHHSSKWWNSSGEEGLYYYTSYLRIDVSNGKVYVRDKETNESLEKTIYYEVSNVVAYGDSLITFRRYYDPDEELMYFEKETPNTRQRFDYLKQYRIVKVRHSDIRLDVSWGNTYLEFFKNGELIDKDELHTFGNAEYYNEKDNW